ncbi:tectonin beta-propeller repeat-containing protein 1-like [Babylonia areolata]|uniref:tectonin beta-propeller repeat-containing protein 1-like n=1 Tax=Babylonia areolata TaxID=304850 RepID=UPI003FD2E19E
MKDPRFWISNRNGNVFTVCASERYIRQLTSESGVRVKRLAASDWCAWAVGHDHRVCLFVLASDVPIRVPGTTYENQRWSPFSGFHSSNLLPTDRRAWSDEHGDVYLPKESIRLPSAHWDWEGDWFIDENLQGEICTDRGGWQYSINFNGRWTPESCWNSCVRKRKWIRFCRYTATNKWAIVSDMEVVEKSECFIDIAVGGQLLPGQPPDFLSVWAITNNGQVYVRTGVWRDCPEGKEWRHIPGHSMGIINIACGPTGLVWAITWDGHTVVRTHVSRDNVYGVGWEMVPYPQESTRLMQVAVGRNSVWALSRDGKVWFRQGVNGDKLFWDATAATGTGWVMMVGEMTHIAVSGNDQVFALGLDDEDKEVWFRTGVTHSEPGGKTWQRVVLEEHPDVFDVNSPSCLLSQPSDSTVCRYSPDDSFTISDCFNASPSCIVQTMGSGSVPLMSFTPSSLISQGPGAVETCPIGDMCPAGNPLEQKDCTSAPDSVLHVTENELTSLHGTVGASVPRDGDTRERTKSWQVIENSIHSDPMSENEIADNAEEADESFPSIPLTPAAEMSADCRRSSHEYPQDQGKETLLVVSLPPCEGDGNVTNNTQQHTLNAEEKTTTRISDIESQVQSTCSEATHVKLPAVDSVAEPGMLSSSVTSDTFDSLESGHSDVICNFVTDLIDDEEEAAISGREDSKQTGKNKSGTETSEDMDSTPVTFQDMHDQEEGGDGSSKDPTSIPWISLGPSETFSGRVFRNVTPSSDSDSVPAMTMTLAQPRYAWGWLAVSDFVMENPSSVPWLSVSKDPQVNYQMPKVSRALRDGILQQLKQRNQKEISGFSNYNHAVERSSWVKRAAMKIQWPSRNGSWYDCSLEMERGVGDEMDGTLTIQFKLKHKPKVIQMSLQEIRCIKMCDDHHLAIYTCDPDTSICPLMLQTSSEADLREWLSIVNMANMSLWQLNRPVAAGSVCSLTVPGQIFIHNPEEASARPCDMMWGQQGGHMALIETTPCGVTWALSFDRTPWVYNGGYGNAFTRELSEMSSSLREQVDYRIIRVFENQKWFPVVGYCSRGVLHNNFAWTTPKGQFVKSREDIKLPSSQWQWVSDWIVDFTTAGGVSNDGWQFATNVHRPYHAQQGLRDTVRRRQWGRKCKLVTQGPWVSVGPPELIDVSLQVEPCTSPSRLLVLWAIGANGDVLCRSQLTQEDPMGKSWIHIPTTSDMPFRSVSVGGGYRVWAVAVDGSVWYRPGVTPLTPAGSCWIQVIPPPPGGALLQHISVGGSAVWAVDSSGNLWRREEITPTFPEGTRWTFVCNHIRRVSVGPKDQVWIVSESNFGRHKHSSGAVYRRLGITDTTPSGTDWELVIGPGWHFVSVRGLLIVDK